MESIFSNLSGRQRLFAIVFTFSLITLLFVFWRGGTIPTIALSGALFVIFFITRRIWLPEDYGKAMVRRFSLTIILVVAGSLSFWNQIIESIVAPVIFQRLQTIWPELRPYQFPPEAYTYVTLVFVLVGIFIINYFMRDTSAMKAHSEIVDKEFPVKTYKQKLQGFCRILLRDLDKIDMETSWSEEYFTPLEAEVEIQTDKKRHKKVTDLLSAIKLDRQSKVFLVLGDPGSGKSVTLRMLCRDLMKEVEATGKVPVYINLREWNDGNEWTENNPPTVEQLYNFVLNNLKERGDVFATEFLDAYFKSMFDHGRFFIILDSFDEIPSVLDTDASSWLIDALSDVIYKFLAGVHESRGILASRIFRKPAHSFQAKTTIEIRPFSEDKIIEMFNRTMLENSESLVKLLFKNRQEFVSIARNPFTAALIVSYAKEHNNTLPATQAELYSDYINRRLKMCQERIRKNKLLTSDIVQRAKEIAYLMFTVQNYGLDVPLIALKEKNQNESIEDEIKILTFSRLGRLGGGDENRFSFVHRRLQEYFVACRLIEDAENVSFEAIPQDSRWRDALVLYCEITTESEATKIAEFCWKEVNKIDSKKLDLDKDQYFRAIHSLRFLRDAFRSRLGCLVNFQGKLADFIEQQIENGELLPAKLAIEAIALLKENTIDSTIIKALAIGNSWITETAIRVGSPNLKNILPVFRTGIPLQI